jgi:L-malate glycosyltransferase
MIKKKILYLLPLFSNTGPSKVVQALIKELPSSDYEIHVATILGETEQVLLDRYPQVTFTTLSGFNLRSLTSLKQYLVKHGISVVHSHGLLPDIFNAYLTLFSKQRTITTLHCNLNEGYVGEYKWYKAHLYKIIHKIALLFTKQCVAVSNAAKQSLPKQGSVIYNGVEQQEVIAKNQYDVSNQEINLLYVGRVIDIKNVGFLIAAARYIKLHTKLILTLHIVGDGDQLATLKEQSQDLNIIFYGHLNQPWQVIKNNTVFVNPSTSEGMPMAVLEAISRGLPALLSSIPAHKELASHFNAGIAIFEFSHQDFLNQLLTMIDNNTVTINQRLLLSDFDKQFTNKAMAGSYSTLYNDEG